MGLRVENGRMEDRISKWGQTGGKELYRPITSLVTVNKTLLSKQITGQYDPTLHQRMTAYKLFVNIAV